jgi:hypothetical protein
VITGRVYIDYGNVFCADIPCNDVVLLQNVEFDARDRSLASHDAMEYTYTAPVSLGDEWIGVLNHHCPRIYPVGEFLREPSHHYSPIAYREILISAA